jgi:uncharacterized protein YcsI (UPF0317 family)
MYTLKKDLVIPAGTIFSAAAVTVRRLVPYIETSIALGDDASIGITLPIEDDYGPFNALFERDVPVTVGAKMEMQAVFRGEKMVGVIFNRDGAWGAVRADGSEGGDFTHQRNAIAFLR